jgi:hypothetical protein
MASAGRGPLVACAGDVQAQISPPRPVFGVKTAATGVSAPCSKRTVLVCPTLGGLMVVMVTFQRLWGLAQRQHSPSATCSRADQARQHCRF